MGALPSAPGERPDPGRPQMRIGLIGLGRIGAFHADTLAALDTVDELVVTDPVVAAVDAVTARIGKATAVAGPEALLDAGVDGVVIAAATAAHAELLLASAGRGIPTFCEKPIAGSADEAVTVRDRLAGSGVAGADRLPAPLRPGLRRRARCRALRRARPGAHRALDHPRPGPAAGRLPGRLRRHLPRLLGARLRRRALGDRPGGGRGLRGRRRRPRRTCRVLRRQR